MELIEVIDDNGNFTGEVVDIKELHDRNLLHHEIVVCIVNDNREVLLQKRSANKRYNANKWAVLAGHVDAKESLEDAALREIKEELGVSVQKRELIPLGIHNLTYYYFVKSNLKEDDFVLQKEELSAVKWVPINEVITRILNRDDTLVFNEFMLSLFKKIK